MIVADRKPFEEIKEKIHDYSKVLILGCGTCTSVCMAGGEKEVGLLASELRMARNMNGGDTSIGEATIQRQCDKEYIQAIAEEAKKYDAVLSMACGAGVQFVAELLEPIPVLPALNTRFIGIAVEEGMWAERCRACGDCLLADTGGICPVTICTKGLMNGPCGGANNGKCEQNDGRDCAWELIYRRLKMLGKLDNLKKLVVRDCRFQDHPGKRIAEAYVKPDLVKERRG